jgi:arylsulfatase A-like enzyme
MAGPGVPAGKKIGGQAQLIDIMPTILDLCGADVPSDINGKSLLPLLKGTASAEREFAFAEADKDNDAPNIKRAIRSNTHKLYYDVRTGNEELYDILDDPGEQKNLIDSRPEVARRLRENLNSWMSGRKGNPKTVPLTEDEMQELRSLGYLR